MPRRWTSRKFLISLAASVGGVVAVFFPSHESEIANAAQQIGGLVAMALSAFGFVQGEAKVDAEREKSNR